MASNGSGFLIQPVQAITPPRPPHQRQRARKACIPCRQRKRKCDVLIPCTMCTTYGYDCRYSENSTAQSGRHTVIQITSPRISSGSNITTNDAVDSGISQHVNKKARLRLDDDVQSRAPQPVIDQGILDPFKSRYMSQNSAVAFPRSLGLDLQSANPPPLHSFAWNCGIRPEEGPSTHVSLSELVSHAEFASYADVYFSIVHPIFGVLDRQHFMQRCDNYYLNNSSQDLELGALMGSVVALGSFFSFRSGHPREMDIVKHVKGVLEDATISRRPTLDQINAWIMRTLYLRSTTRPHVAWLASTMTLHLAEAVGLHHEVHSVLLTTENTIQSVEPDQAGAEQARRTFWTAWSTNTIMAYEYGRSQRTFSSISCKPIKPVAGDFTAQHILLAQLIPGDNATEPEQKEDLQHALKQLQQVPNDSSFMSLAKADVCFCFYRRLRLLKQGLEKETVRSIIGHGNKAVAAASELAQKGCPWWNILSTVFQYFCVLLAIDTSESLSTVSSVLENLENIVQILDTHLAREALETAKVLLGDSMAKKRHDLALLEVTNGTSLPGSDKDVDINWDALLDPSYSEVLMSQDFPQF